MGLFDFVGNLFGGNDKSRLDSFELPDFFEDPVFKESQDTLFDFGKDLLAGEPNDFFRSIGESGGPELEGLITQTLGDVSQGVSEQLARSGRARGGALASATGAAASDIIPKLRFQDFLRAQAGKQNLLNTGVNVTEGVRGAALQNQAGRNSFNLGRSSLDLNARKAQDDQDLTEGGLLGGSISSLLDIAGGAVVGGASGGVPGAILGGLGGIEILPEIDDILKDIGLSKKTEDDEDRASELGDIDLSSFGLTSPKLSAVG